MSIASTDIADRSLLGAPRRCLANVVASFRRLGRPIDWRRAFPWIVKPAPVLIGLAVVLGAALVVMALIDAPVTRAVQRLPVWFLDLANFLTDFGKGAWVLWPLGLFYLFLAALPRPATRMAQLVHAAIMVRAGFLFASIGLTGLSVSLVKNIIGRARPGVGGSINPFLFEPLHWAPAYASFPSGHGTTVFAVLAAFGSRVHALDHLDGVTVDLGDGSWFTLRMSNTEPLLRLNVEARDADTVAALRDEALAIIRKDR